MILATETDKLGSQVQIKYTANIGSSPVVAPFMHGYATLIEQGYAYSNLAGHNKNSAIYAEIDNEFAGFIVYDLQDDPAKTCWIIFGSVLEKFRRRGLYKIMHSHLENVVRKSNSKQIFSFVHKDNIAMLELSKQIGKQPVLYRVDMML
jgi:ribosomal protein S18 acetylase RimI-like enzyme